MVVYKFPLAFFAEQWVDVGDINARALSVGEQGGQLMMWVGLDQKKKSCGHRLLVNIYGTGEVGNMAGRFIGSVQMSSGLVWHVFVSLEGDG